MYTLLLVDDEPDILDGLERAIPWAQYGFSNILKLQSATDALALLGERPVDLLITDIRMPDMDGLTMLGKMREANIDTLTIVVSSYSEFDLVRQALRLSASNYLLKPIDVQELSAAARDAVTGLRASRKPHESIFRETVLYRWLHGTISSGELDERSQFVGINTFYRNYAVALVSTPEPTEVPLPAEALMRRFAGEMGDWGNVYPVRADEGSFALIIGSNNPLDSRFSDALTELLATENVVFALGCAVSDCADVHESYHSARERLPYAALRELPAEGRLPDNDAVHPAPSSPVVLAAIDYIQSNYLKPVSLKLFCSRIRANSSYVGQLFRSETGRYFTEYVAHVRIGYAKHMLAETNLSVQEIACATGFNSSATMIQNFNKFTGMSPRQYRLAVLCHK